MIIIDKTKENNSIIVTVSELATIDDPTYIMVIYSGFTNKTYQIELPANISPSKERYDEFLVDTLLFKDVEEGFYVYTIYQDSIMDDFVVEIGVLQVVGTVETYISIQQLEEADDYIVYSPD